MSVRVEPWQEDTVVLDFWIRPKERVVCPDCKGLRWLPIDLWHREAGMVTTTVDCPFCHGRGWVLKNEGDGRGYERSLSNG